MPRTSENRLGPYQESMEDAPRPPNPNPTIFLLMLQRYVDVHCHAEKLVGVIVVFSPIIFDLLFQAVDSRFQHLRYYLLEEIRDELHPYSPKKHSTIVFLVFFWLRCTLSRRASVYPRSFSCLVIIDYPLFITSHQSLQPIHSS